MAIEPVPLKDAPHCQAVDLPDAPHALLAMQFRMGGVNWALVLGDAYEDGSVRVWDFDQDPSGKITRSEFVVYPNFTIVHRIASIVRSLREKDRKGYMELSVQPRAGAEMEYAKKVLQLYSERLRELEDTKGFGDK